MSINIQPTLENEKVMLTPLQEKDFDDLYAVAADPKIWEQHLNKHCYKIETLFSQLCDQFMIKRNYAKSLDDFKQEFKLKLQL